MKKIKSFIYLDNDKMYSISSQLFEGLTEYVVKSERQRESEAEEQKGSLGSGRLMADIIETESGHSEKRFLHHYSYNLFEDELSKGDKILSIDKENIDNQVADLENYNFVKITGRVIFNDSSIVEEILSKFNGIGEALTYAVHNKELTDLKEQTSELVGQVKDRNQKNKVSLAGNQANMIRSLAKKGNLHLDPKFLESLITIVNYGYNNSFEVQVPLSTDNNYYLFSSLLNRDLLAESEQSLIKKYSRESEKEFTVFGIITQVLKKIDKDPLFTKGEDQELNMKEAVMNIISSITNVESTFNGKMDYEYVIDPIAIYREI
jgi:hypothetical protein